MEEKATLKKMRLFAALPVPAGLKEQIDGLPRKGLDARWTHPDDLHITLRFLGDVTPDRVPDIKAALDRVRRPVFGVEAQGFGTFNLSRQVVLWAAVQSTRKLTTLAAEINEVLEPLGFEMPRKPYQPHITIARLKSAKGLEAYTRQHESRIKCSWQAASFGLFLSGEPGEKGNRYNVLAEYPLVSKP